MNTSKIIAVTKEKYYGYNTTIQRFSSSKESS